MNLRHWCVAGGCALCACVLAFSAVAQDSTAVPNPPPLAHIGAFTRAVSYGFNFSPAEMVLGQHPISPAANISEAWIYARLFTASGKEYVLMRIVDDNKTLGVTLQADNKPDARVTRIAADGISRTVDPAAGLVFSGKDFDVKVSPDAVSWSDVGGAITLSGSGSPLGRVGTGEYLPYIQKDGTSGFDDYNGVYQPVTGTVFGEPVKGMFIIDHFFGTEKDRDPSYRAANKTIWFKFANTYEDGSVEVGEFFQVGAGEHGAGMVPAMHGGVVVSAGKLIANSDNPQVKFVLDKDGKVKTETWSIGKMQWQYVPGGFAARSVGNTGLVGEYGGVHRVGDKRRIVNQYARTEYLFARLAPDQIVHGK